MSAGDDRPGARPAPPVTVSGACQAPGCSWAGSSGVNGHFLCIAHVGQDSRDHARISERTHDLAWFAQFIADIQRMQSSPRKGEDSWISYADAFWDQSDRSMQPAENERRKPPLYVYRMFGELRAMALGKERPAPHVPQRLWRDWSQPAHGTDGNGVPA